ncbi:glycosyltransferase [Maribellus sediminis]|uniref:glycosyltransferase n=1 Tax=Maribellus sediminis TaxID=2696285 RepID=UPI0014300F3B|nr:glycosyltransferase [Maribellus sediminis]
MNHNILDKLQELNAGEWILIGIFLFLLVFRMYYLVFFTGRQLFKSRKVVIANEKAAQPISVFTTVRNEEENLKRVLPQLLEISNVKYEVIAVDDYSLDNTFTVLGAFKHRYPHFRISSLNEETRFSVKLAQNIALKAAQYDWVLQFPISGTGAGNDWLSGFAYNTTSQNRKLLLGYTGIKAKTGFYNLLCRIEMFMQQVKSAGFICNGIPFVYFEDNVAFKRQEYFKLGGYGQKTREAYANLELLINKFITKKETAVLFNETTRLTIDVPTEKDDFLNLIKRSERIERYLPAWKRFMLAFEAVTEMLYLPFLVFVLVYFFELWLFIVVLAGVKLLAHLIIIKIVQNRLNERKIFISSLVYGLLMPYFKLVYRWHFKQQSRNRNGR